LDFISAIRANIRKHSMIPRGVRVLAAVSGGQDSMALMYALYRLRKSMDFELGVAHIDHKIRRTSHDDLEFVRNKALELGLPFYSDTLNVKKVSALRKMGIEETARELRYAALTRIAEREGYKLIATGHTASDQAETVLMRIFSGTGVRGLSGIMPVRGDGVIRPMLGVTRAEVEAFIAMENLPFVNDETNTDTTITRNLIRLVLLPLIEEKLNPRVPHALAGIAESAGNVSAFIEAAAGRRLKSLVSSSASGMVSIRREGFNALHPALKGPVLEAALDMVEKSSRLDRDHIEKICRLAGGGGGAKSVNLPGRVTANISYDSMTLSSHKKTKIPKRCQAQIAAGAVSVPGPGTFPIPWAGVTIKFGGRARKGGDSATWDRDLADYPFTVRPFRSGDRIGWPFHRHTRKLKKLFIDQKIPREERAVIPIVCRGDTVIWIPGITTPQAPENPRCAIHAAVVEK
jgi:tRNA(Ile)-lysidine synthase